MAVDKKIIVGVSGGVDSGVSLFLLNKKGYKPLALTLKNTDKTPVREARLIAEKAGVPHFVLDKRKEFEEKIISYFLEEIRRGRTPNPCLLCNPYFKFKNILSFARGKGAEKIATGHYARVEKKQGQYHLLKAKDKSKDQTYYLSFLTQKELAQITFPIGEHKKEKVQKLAEKFKIKNIAVEESQNFCALKDNSFRRFIKQRIGENPGKIIDEKGNLLGEHPGIYFYTIGQRKGLDLSGGPYYVKNKVVKDNKLVVTKDRSQLEKKKIEVEKINWILGSAPDKSLKVTAKIRYRHKAAPVELQKEKRKTAIIFKKPQFAPTPGQFCVFYQKEICLGAGIIKD